MAEHIDENNYDNFHDHPYSSPSEDSDRDEDIEELDFQEFDGFTEGSESEDNLEAVACTETSGEEYELDLEPDDSGLPRWCTCGNCPLTSNKIEAVCCNDRPEIVDLLPAIGRCVTELDIFLQQIISNDSLICNRLILASTIKSEAARQEYLNKEFSNRLKRHLAYRTFLLVVNKGCPLGRYNRVVIPRCVVSRIRHAYPESDSTMYTGFLDIQNTAAKSASANK